MKEITEASASVGLLLATAVDSVTEVITLIVVVWHSWMQLYRLFAQSAAEMQVAKWDF